MDCNISKYLVEKYPLSVRLNASLADLTYWKVGGNAEVVIEPSTLEELSEIASYLHSVKQKYVVIGDTSNLLFDSGGLNCPLIKIGNSLNHYNVNDTTVYCQAGMWVPELAYIAYRNGLTGLEHICGIPGRIGGLIYMNGGSQRKSISDYLVSVDTLSQSGKRITYFRKDLEFSYRCSPFQQKNEIILAATFLLKPESRSLIRNEMLGILSSRRKKFPRKLPSCGSVFVSNPKMYDEIGPPGFAIEQVGLKGSKKGGAQISPIHANFIVNNGEASSEDVLWLLHKARDKVFEHTGYLMESEARFVKTDGEIVYAHETVKPYEK